MNTKRDVGKETAGHTVLELKAGAILSAQYLQQETKAKSHAVEIHTMMEIALITRHGTTMTIVKDHASGFDLYLT